MKNQSEFLRKAMMTACTMLSLFVCECSFAQEGVQSITLLLERQNPARQVSFVLGQTVSYKTIYSKNFMNGRLQAITDSTVLFEHNDQQNTQVFTKDLTVLKPQGSYEIIDLKIPMTRYNLNHVSIKLKSGMKIFGKLISIKSDSLFMQLHSKKPFRTVCYTEIESIGIHKKGSGGFGTLIGAIAGGGIGAIMGAASRPTHDPTGLGGLAVPAGAILGFLIVTPIGAAVGSSNRQHLIQGDQQKFHLLVEKINKRLWTLKVSKGLSKS